MTDDERRELRTGDLVMVEMDDGSTVIKRVRRKPWELKHGEWVVGLSGIAGGYLLSRVRSLVSEGER